MAFTSLTLFPFPQVIAQNEIDIGRELSIILVRQYAELLDDLPI